MPEALKSLLLLSYDIPERGEKGTNDDADDDKVMQRHPKYLEKSNYLPGLDNS